MNNQLDRITQSFTIKLADRVRGLQREGMPVVGLQSGDPDFDTPQPIIDAMKDALDAGYTHYSNSRGLPALRNAISAKTASHSRVEYDPESEILVTHGAVHAYYTGLQAIMNPGDSVLVPDPSWQTHANMVKVLRGTPIRVTGTLENDFFPTIEAWRDAITDNTVAIIINTPCNPTGTVAERDYLQALVDLATEHDLYIVADEVYDHLLYGREHVSVASLNGAKERTLLLNSFSKTYAMTGWRIGYLCAAEHIITSALKASQHSVTNIAEFTQRAAIVALTDSSVQARVKEMVNAYEARRDLVKSVYAGFVDTPVKLNDPQGAFYFFIDVRALGMPSTTIAERLLQEAHVALVPGSVYGEAGEGFLRMTTAASDEEVKAGIRGLLQWVESVPV